MDPVEEDGRARRGGGRAPAFGRALPLAGRGSGPRKNEGAAQPVGGCTARGALPALLSLPVPWIWVAYGTVASSNRFQSSFNGCKSRGRGVCFETSNVTTLVIIFHAYAPRQGRVRG